MDKKEYFSLMEAYRRRLLVELKNSSSVLEDDYEKGLRGYRLLNSIKSSLENIESIQKAAHKTYQENYKFE